MRTWNIVAIALLISGICAAQDLEPGALVRGEIDIDQPALCTYQIKVYEADTTSPSLTTASGYILGSVEYRTYPLYGLWSYPLVDVKCTIKDGLGQTIYSETVQNVPSVYYLEGGAIVNFDFTDACESYSSSAAVDEPSNGTSAFDTDTWAGIKSGN